VLDIPRFAVGSSRPPCVHLGDPVPPVARIRNGQGNLFTCWGRSWGIRRLDFDEHHPRYSRGSRLFRLSSRTMEDAAGLVVLGPWSLVLGPWSLVLGPWSLVWKKCAFVLNPAL